MNTLNAKQKELVALGASVASNCIPCVKYHIHEARGTGLSDEEIQEAIDLADKVRQVPARKVMETASATLRADKGGAPKGEVGCGCPEDLSQSKARSRKSEPCCDPAMMKQMMKSFAGQFQGQCSSNSTSEPGEDGDSQQGCDS